MHYTHGILCYLAGCALLWLGVGAQGASTKLEAMRLRDMDLMSLRARSLALGASWLRALAAALITAMCVSFIGAMAIFYQSG